MNQNNIQRIRQVTPQEVAQARGIKLTQEELQKTHVLNLQEVKEAVRYEKMTSKKPAIFVAIVGALLIAFGTSFQVAKTMSSNANNKIEQRNTAKSEETPITKEVKSTSLTCQLLSPNNEDGTDTTFSIIYNFKNDKLINFTKTFNVTITPGSTIGSTTIQSYLKAYQAFLNQLSGYQISVNPTDNGFITIVNVNYSLLNIQQLPEVQQTHFSTKVDYAMDTSYTQISQDMLNNGFTCK